MTQMRRLLIQLGDDGYTLLEVLVAMTLLSLLSTALVAGVQSGTAAWRAADVAATEDNRMRHVQAELSGLIARAYPEVAPNAEDGHVAFEGHPGSMTLLAPDPDLPGALDRVTITLNDARDGGKMFLARKLELATSDRNTRRETLLNAVAALEIAYFGKRDANATAAWQENWVDRTILPQSVRIRVVFANPHARRWPEFVAEPRIAASAGCTYDPLTKFCEGH